MPVFKSQTPLLKCQTPGFSLSEKYPINACKYQLKNGHDYDMNNLQM